MLLCTMLALAQTFEVDGIKYKVTSTENLTVEVTRGSSRNSGDVAIPNEVEYNSNNYSVTSIGGYAFYKCSGLTSITIPNRVTSIGSGAFRECSGLTSITIPNSVTSIGDYAFIECISLTSITIPNSVTSIGWFAFQECSNLTSITIPNSVTSIGDYAFSRCSGLTSITIPNSVTTIGKSAFSYCSRLTSITIPNSVTSIGVDAFGGCTGLTSVTIPNSVTSIGQDAFYRCSGLTSITIPNSVTSIGNWAFEYCTGLTEVVSMIEKPFEISGACFGGDVDRDNIPLYVPKGTKALYEATEGWNVFKNIVEMEEPASDPIVSNDNQLDIADVSTHKGETVAISINLENNTSDLTAYQFDLTLPEGFTIAKDNNEKYQVTKTSRYEDDNQSLTISLLNENTYRIVCFSLTNGIIEGESGAILNAIVAVDDAIAEGTYEGKIENIVFTEENGTQLKLSNSTFNFVVNKIIMGDANGDDEINVADIVEIVNVILNKTSDRFVSAAADMNGDGEINVTDIVYVVNIILSGNTNSSRAMISARHQTNNDYLTLVRNEDRTLSLCLDNQCEYVASQFDIRLSDGQSLESVKLNNARMGKHLITYSEVGHNLYRVIVYSLENESYIGNNGELMNISVIGEGNVDIDNILFTTASHEEKRFSPLQSGTTGISTAKTVNSNNVYMIDGRLVRKQVSSSDGLAKGVYIINGKKQIVR